MSQVKPIIQSAAKLIAELNQYLLTTNEYENEDLVVRLSLGDSQWLIGEDSFYIGELVVPRVDPNA